MAASQFINYIDNTGNRKRGTNTRRVQRKSATRMRAGRISGQTSIVVLYQENLRTVNPEAA